MADNLGLGAFASGLANGWQMGMNMQDRQNGAAEAKKATEQKQAASSTTTGQTPQAGQNTGGMGLPAQPAPAAQQTQAPAQQGGASPWSFIGSLFGGGNG